MNKILIVEDDEEIAALEKDYLEANGFETEIITDGKQVLEKVLWSDISLILLDVMLPEVNGYEICKKLRDKTSVPILMVTARSESIDKIRGLGLGANDYITKPFDPAELVARVKSHISTYKRLTASEDSNDNTNAIIIGNLKILPRSYKVFKSGHEVKLPNREFQLLLFLAQNPNTVFSKEYLFEKIWGFDYVGDSATVTVHINRIRDKIEDDATAPKIIETVWGAGYILNK